MSGTPIAAVDASAPVIVDVAVYPTEIPFMPHFDTAKAWKFDIGKLREVFAAA
jgi:hypothetical protein